MENDLDMLKVIVDANDDTDCPHTAVQELMDMLYHENQSTSFSWQVLYNIIKGAYVGEPQW